MQRREFLKSSLALGALAALPWSSATGKAGDALRIGLIGTGMRGQVLLGELLKQEGVDIVAMCDIDRFALDGAARILA